MMAKDYPVRIKLGWYLAKMNRLEWLETVFKLSAVGCGIAAFATGFSLDELSISGGWRLLQVIVLGIISIGLLGAIWERFGQQEIGAMLFVLLNVLGHWGLLLALFGDLENSSLVIAFSSLMITGEITKFTFFATSSFTIRGSPRTLVLAVVFMFMAAYSVILALEFFA